jgi:hypothetical protein
MVEEQGREEGGEGVKQAIREGYGYRKEGRYVYRRNRVGSKKEAGKGGV